MSQCPRSATHKARRGFGARWIGWLAARSLKTQKEAGEHSLWLFPHVVSVLKLSEVLWQVLARNVDMCTPDGPLEDRPKAFERVHMNVAPSVFLGPVVNCVVPVT